MPALTVADLKAAAARLAEAHTPPISHPSMLGPVDPRIVTIFDLDGTSPRPHEHPLGSGPYRGLLGVTAPPGTAGSGVAYLACRPDPTPAPGAAPLEVMVEVVAVTAEGLTWTTRTGPANLDALDTPTAALAALLHRRLGLTPTAPDDPGDGARHAATWIAAAYRRAVRSGAPIDVTEADAVDPANDPATPGFGLTAADIYQLVVAGRLRYRLGAPTPGVLEVTVDHQLAGWLGSECFAWLSKDCTPSLLELMVAANRAFTPAARRHVAAQIAQRGWTPAAADDLSRLIEHHTTPADDNGSGDAGNDNDGSTSVLAFGITPPEPARPLVDPVLAGALAGLIEHTPAYFLPAPIGPLPYRPDQTGIVSAVAWNAGGPHHPLGPVPTVEPSQEIVPVTVTADMPADFSEPFADLCAWNPPPSPDGLLVVCYHDMAVTADRATAYREHPGPARWAAIDPAQPATPATPHHLGAVTVDRAGRIGYARFIPDPAADPTADPDGYTAWATRPARVRIYQAPTLAAVDLGPAARFAAAVCLARQGHPLPDTPGVLAATSRFLAGAWVAAVATQRLETGRPVDTDTVRELDPFRSPLGDRLFWLDSWDRLPDVLSGLAPQPGENETSPVCQLETLIETICDSPQPFDPASQPGLIGWAVAAAAWPADQATQIIQASATPPAAEEMLDTIALRTGFDLPW